MKTSNRGSAAAAVSTALAAVALIRPRQTARAVGLRSPGLVRAVGAQEAIAAAGLAIRPHSPGFLWLRAGGDVMHLGILAGALARKRSARGRLIAAMTAVGATLVADVRAARRQTESTPGGALHTRSTVTINRPPEDVYELWRDLERLPEQLSHVAQVTVLDGARSHWTAHGPAGADVEWDAVIVADEPGTRIAWRSIVDAGIPNSGIVSFQPHGGATEMTVDIEFSLPAGGAAATVARLLGEHPDEQLDDDLRRFKQVAETGQVLRSDAAPEGTRIGDLIRQRPARPVSP